MTLADGIMTALAGVSLALIHGVSAGYARIAEAREAGMDADFARGAFGRSMPRLAACAGMAVLGALLLRDEATGTIAPGTTLLVAACTGAMAWRLLKDTITVTTAPGPGDGEG